MCPRAGKIRGQLRLAAPVCATLRTKHAMCVASIPMWVITTALHAEFAMCVFSVPHVGYLKAVFTPWASFASPCGIASDSDRTSGKIEGLVPSPDQLTCELA